MITHDIQNDSNFILRDLLIDNEQSFDELDISFEKELKEHELNLKQKKSSSRLNDESGMRFGGTKHKQLFSKIKSSIQNFVSDFNNYTEENLYRDFADEMTDLIEEKCNRKLQIFKTYQTQISEMNSLMRDDESHEESIKVIIDNLEEEKKDELKKVDEEYGLKINEMKKKFKADKMNKDSGIQLIEEKFKLDMLNSVNEILYPKSISK